MVVSQTPGDLRAIRRQFTDVNGKIKTFRHHIDIALAQIQLNIYFRIVQLKFPVQRGDDSTAQRCRRVNPQSPAQESISGSRYYFFHTLQCAEQLQAFYQPCQPRYRDKNLHPRELIHDY
ncbi:MULTISPECIES: hypothetical protein [Enterobacteriaceae]|uniref:hypothetical protein n=1 Tax=Enterobacteriaceae TaxID=543 RepID=UPI0006A5FDA7|nr:MULTISPECIES: hypothetical protein [Enterobacteriaceae]